MPSLASAIKANDLAKVQKLIAKDRANVKETRGTIALSQAAHLGHLKIVQVLIESGAEVNDEDRVIYPSEAPLAQAAAQGYLEIVRVLLKAGAEVNIHSDDPEYLTPLMYGVSSGNIEIVKLLVEAGANVNEIRSGGNFALMIAAEVEHQEIFEYLAPLTDIVWRQEAEKVLFK
jgi:ankyrin repeat protein